MKQERILCNKIVLVIAMLVLCLMPFVLSSCANVTCASAASETKYTNVLVDLYKDDEFNVEDYPSIEDDYSLHVIQIAESADKELFVYVYQPANMQLATKINMSIENDQNYSLYDLTFLNSYGVFFKYKVSGFKVSYDQKRYYNVASIFRKWDPDLDKEMTGQIEISYSVGQICVAEGYGESATYDYTNVEVLEIKSQLVANVVSFKNDFFSWMHATETGYTSHVIAFSTDRQIDTILEADVYAKYHYAKQTISSHGLGYVPKNYDGKQYGTKVNLQYDEVASVSKHGKTYKFKRIMRTSNYLHALGDEAEPYREELSSYDWVLCVSEATDFFSYTYTGIGFGYTQIGATLIDEGSILRLKFDVGGVTYDMGCVSNITKSQFVVGETRTWLKDLLDWFNGLARGLKIFLIVVLVLVLLSICVPLVMSILKAIFGKGD